MNTRKKFTIDNKNVKNMFGSTKFNPEQNLQYIIDSKPFYLHGPSPLTHSSGLSHLQSERLFDLLILELCKVYLINKNMKYIHTRIKPSNTNKLQALSEPTVTPADNK